MYFCLNCFASKEDSVREQAVALLSRLTTDQFLVWFPKKEVMERRQGKYEKVTRPLFSGYLFIYWEGEHEVDFPFSKVRMIPGAIRFLNYDDGSRGLKGKDLSFAKWVHMHDGLIGKSVVRIREGQRVHICEGPLTGFDGNVVKVDKHHKRITLRFEVGGIVSEVNFSVDFINESAKVSSFSASGDLPSK